MVKYLVIVLVMVFSTIDSKAQNNLENKKTKKSIKKRLWGGYDSNAVKKNLIIKDAFVTEKGKLLKNVLVSIKTDKITIDTMLTDKNGGFETELAFDKKYILHFSKKGYITKLVEIDLSDFPAEYKNEGYDLGRFQLGMIKYVSGMNIVEYKTPVARYYFDERTKLITLDRVYLKNKKEAIEKQLLGNEKVQVVADSENAEKQEEYDLLIRDADIEFNEKQYQSAKEYYQEAIKLKPLEEYPREQLKKVNTLLGEKLSLDAKYKIIIENGNEAFDDKDYATAKASYLSAIKINTTDPYTRKRLKEIEDLLLSQKQGSKKKEKFTLENIEISTDSKTFSSNLASKYPQGLTEEKYKKGSKAITKRIIVDGDRGVEYKHVFHDWGGSYYFKNGKLISHFIWQKEAIQN